MVQLCTVVIPCSLRVSVEKHVPTPDGSGVVNRSKLTPLGNLLELIFEMGTYWVRWGQACTRSILEAEAEGTDVQGQFSQWRVRGQSGLFDTLSQKTKESSDTEEMSQWLGVFAAQS